MIMNNKFHAWFLFGILKKSFRFKGIVYKMLIQLYIKSNDISIPEVTCLDNIVIALKLLSLFSVISSNDVNSYT